MLQPTHTDDIYPFGKDYCASLNFAFCESNLWELNPRDLPISGFIELQQILGGLIPTVVLRGDNMLEMGER